VSRERLQGAAAGGGGVGAIALVVDGVRGYLDGERAATGLACEATSTGSVPQPDLEMSTNALWAGQHLRPWVLGGLVEHTSSPQVIALVYVVNMMVMQRALPFVQQQLLL
jgi:hypothetical protein